MALNLETLLTPVSDEAPAGEDLAYDTERVEIDQAFERPPSIDLTTGEAAGGPEVDWRRILKLIESQSGKSKDLWLAVYICRAGAWSRDLATVRLGSEYLAGLCETLWDHVHPTLDDYGFQGRKGPCESLASVGNFLTPLRGVTLLEHARMGRFSGGDFERFAANAESEEGYSQFRAVLSETPDDSLTGIAAELDAIAAAIRRTDAVLVARADGDTGANFRATYDALAQMRQAVLSFSASPPSAEASPGAGGGVDETTGPRIAGRVDSREDVIRTLDSLSDYYRRKEPASPVQQLLQRAREWVNLDFLAILADIAPNSVDEARQVLSFKKPEPGAEY